MKEEQEYIRDITAMRSMMERSSKFMWLSGLSGIMAGVYALVGAFIAYKLFRFNPKEVIYDPTRSADLPFSLLNVMLLGGMILILTLGTAAVLSYQKADKRGERLWNATTKRVIINMAVPLAAGGVLILILISNGLIGLVAPFTLLFYGLAQYNASKFTFEEMRSLGLVEIVLGLISSYYVEYGLLFWALGFGIVHIVYGIYLYYRYER